MIGLIKKDLAMIKGNFKFLAIFIILYFILGLMGKMDISFILPFMSVIIMISTFSYDNYNKWDAYVITLPNGRKNSVKSKYVATILLILILTIVTVLLSFIITYCRYHILDYEEILSLTTGSIFGTLLVLSFMYPIIYKFGVEKARIVICSLVFGIVILGSFIIKYIDLTGIIKILNIMQDYWIIVILLFSFLLVYASYRLSLKIYLKKEF